MYLPDNLKAIFALMKSETYRSLKFWKGMPDSTTRDKAIDEYTHRIWMLDDLIRESVYC